MNGSDNKNSRIFAILTFVRLFYEKTLSKYSEKLAMTVCFVHTINTLFVLFLNVRGKMNWNFFERSGCQTIQ
jgi:hypothetical protein